MKFPVYLDHHASTPVDPAVFDVMTPFFKNQFGNPASTSHPFGWEAQKAIDKARSQAASLISADPGEIVFTSGATESNNLALKGICEIQKGGIHIITQQTEHKSVLAVCRYLEKKGVKVTYLPVDSHGVVSIEALNEAITPETVLVSIMFANNEVGTIQPIEEIGRITKEKGIFFHVDGAQAAGKVQVDVNQLGIDLFSFTAHKMYGPKGTGALYLRKRGPRVRIAPLIHGGEHESGLRSGTLNTAGIAGFGKACEIAAAVMEEEGRRLTALRQSLYRALGAHLGEESIHLNGHPDRRLPGNLNVSFADVEAEALLMAVNEKLAVSTSSACSSGNSDPSYVLKAMHTPRRFIHNAIRFGLGRFTTREEVEWTASYTAEAVKKLRELSPFYKEDHANG